MKLAVLFSGGKDSCYAMHLAAKEHEIACLVTVIPENKESYMFHTPNIGLTKLQAEALGLPQIMEKTPGEKEKELEELERAIKRAKEEYGIGGVVTGAIESVYQASRVQRICDRLGLQCINPLWKMDQITLLRKLLEDGFRVIISGVFGYPLDESWLGREIDEKAIAELGKLKEKYSINPSGEGGEIETFVTDGPMFHKKIVILQSEKTYKNHSGVFYIRKAELAEK